MVRNVSRRQLLAGGGLGALGSLAGCLATGRSATETVTETYPIDDLTALELESVTGSITVADSDGDAIEVTADKAAPTEDALESVTLVSSRNDGHLTLETNHDEMPFLFGPDPKADLEVTVPSAVRLARAETTDGDVEIRNVTGDLVAGTTNGRVDIEGVEGGVSAETTNGGIRVAGVSGDVDANTTNGDIDVSLTAGGGNLAAESTNGDLAVRAPDSLDATISVSTTNGDISVDGVGNSSPSGDGSLEVTLGDGTRRVRLETTNGDVTLRGPNTS